MKPALIWGTQDGYVELVNFKMKVSSILETKVYELSEEKNVPVIKNWLG